MSSKLKLKTHLAICTEPFLSMILSGKKKVESRFSKNKIAPYDKVSKNDLVILKKSGGKVMGSFCVKRVEYFEIKNKKTLKELENKYSKIICADAEPNFWQKRISARYASFIWIEKLTPLKSFPINKSGRSGWRILK